MRKTLGKPPHKKHKNITEAEVEQRTRALVEYSKNITPLHDCVQLFLGRQGSVEFQLALAQFLYLVSSNAALSSVLPIVHLDFIEEFCASVETKSLTESQMHSMKKVCVELGALLEECSRENLQVQQICVAFVRHMLSRVRLTQHLNRTSPYQDPSPIPGTYNPPSGTCYYFNPTGEQLRRQPKYNMAGKEQGDNEPTDEDCEKMFPRSSKGGFGYLFLWFCGLHGHCYGFHLIKGGEGRKDPFSSLFKYLETAPDHIYYDFACQFNEYCLNREPGYFGSARFWHDLFHALNHICGSNFKSTRILGLREGVNSAIGEQGNAWLQSLKYTLTHLSQDHFMMLMQFFIHIFNKEKTATFQQKVEKILAGVSHLRD